MYCVCVCQSVGQSVCSLVCMCVSSQGEISSVFPSLTCFISKDQVVQTSRRTQSDKTDEQLQSGKGKMETGGELWVGCSHDIFTDLQVSLFIFNIDC